MKLKTPPLKTPQPRFHQVRETTSVVQALKEEAARAGISSTEAIKQIIAAYLAKPFVFSLEPSKGRKSAVWANVKTDKATLHSFTAHTMAHGVTVAEGIRQCVRRFLVKRGRAF